MAARTRILRILFGTLFGLLALAIVAAAHAYLARRLIQDPALPSAWTRGLVALLVVLGVSLVVAPIAERSLPRRVARFILWPAAVWMGFSFLTLSALVASELGGWLLGAAGGDAGLLGARVRALAVSGVAAAAGGVALREGLRPPRLERVEVGLERWPAALDRFRIVQISDIHIGPILDRRFARQLVERVNALAPDLVVVTGDLVDGDAADLRDEVAPFAELAARHGVFFVTGNHDYFSGVDPWVARVRELGMRPLRNERVCIERDGSSFELAGVEDHRSGLYGDGPGEDLRAALDGWDRAAPLVLLAHDPSTFHAAAREPIDFQISGHTHGGQIWPFRYAVRAVIPFVAGLYRVGRATLYVSRGTGFWGPPMRLGAPAEITELSLRPARAVAAEASA